MRVSTMLVFGLSIMAGLCTCSGVIHPLNAFSPGDIIIGGLFPLHLLTNGHTEPETCSDFSLQSFLQSQVMIYAIREINQRGSPRHLPNIQLGYDIYDTYANVSVAIRATLQLLRNQIDSQSCLLPAHVQSALPEPQTKAVIGERDSETTIAVARVIALSSVAQISYASTSELLSRKLKFPTFLRTISSDEYQTKAICELVKKFNWQTVAIVGSDDEYGKYGSDKLVNIFNKMNICIEFVHILPGDYSHNSSKSQKMLSGLVRNMKKSSAEATVLFTKGTNVALIIEAAIRHRLNRTWIASDSWSTSAKISSLPGIHLAGEVFGVISKQNEVPGFREYVLSAFNGTTNSIIQQYLACHPICSGHSGVDVGANCSLAKIQQGPKQCLDLSCLVNFLDQDQSYNIYLAIQVIAQSLRNLLKCDHRRCKRSTNFKASELLMEIKRVNFTVNGTHLFFDANGDPSLGYDIVYWNKTRPKQIVQTIGEYWPNGKIILPDCLVGYHDVMVTAYNCSKKCKPGQELKQQNKKCCKECVPCAEGEFSPGNGKGCKRCKDNEYSSAQRDQCLEKQTEFLQRSDPFTIFLSSLEVFGIIVTIVFAVLFTVYRGTPIVKAVGGYLCFLELFSLVVCFCLTFTFAGKPTKLSCMLGLPGFGIAFSLCMSCILANLLQILVGFHFRLQSDSWVKKLNKPMAVVMVVSGIQLGVCVPWVYFFPPYPASNAANTTILLYCKKGSIHFLITMLTYNALLALICFLFAFKGKKLPDLYKNASLISISMLLYLIVWIFFIPIHTNMNGKYKRAIESVAILVSCYSILGCHFAPKCYMMVFRKEINNENAITEYIRKHYEQQGVAVVNS